MGELQKVGNAVYTLVLQRLVGCHMHTRYIASNSMDLIRPTTVFYGLRHCIYVLSSS